jgi:hypothetical protein
MPPLVFEDRPADTTPQAWEAYLQMMREMDPSQKFVRVFELSAALRAWGEAGVRLRFPQASDREVQLRAAALTMDRCVFIRAFGWDPDSDDPVPERA